MKMVDSSDLKSDFDQWPKLALSIWNEPSNRDQFPRLTNYSRLLFAGMGGSGISGEILLDYSKEKRSKVVFETLKDYHLPNYVDNNSLVVGMSSSGNTEETLGVLSEASRRGIDGWTFGSGGLIETFSETKWHFPFTRTRMLKVPRSSFPGMFFYVLKELWRSGLVELDPEDVLESIKQYETVRKKCNDVDKSNPALQLSKRMVTPDGASPLIYASARTHAVGLRVRQSINENAKLHAFDGTVPELCHNDIVGWDSKGSHCKTVPTAGTESRHPTLLLRLVEDDPIEIKTRFDIIQEIISSSKGESFEAPYEGSSYLCRILTMFYYLDYATYFMAILRGVDPIKTPSIDLLKKALASRMNYVEMLR
jgi:glucose/mannose-6-phosphate isomerase